jgi:hypothetical protein
MKRIFYLAWLISCCLISAEAEVELPFNWKGLGEATILTYNGLETLQFNLEINIDQQGNVSGSTFTAEGGLPIERLFFGPEKEGVRDAIIITVLHENENPTLFILKGRALYYQLYFAEVLTKKYEKNGAIELALELGNRRAVGFSGELPESLKNAIHASQTIGCVRIIVGDEDTQPDQNIHLDEPASAGVPQEASSVIRSTTPGMSGEIQDATPSQ